jgi:tRNA threonylcarbamoyladenosine biosynthesis protein TsaE
MSNSAASTVFSTPDDTSAFATAFAQTLVPGDVILLQGDIGAGKTHFARSAIQSLLSHPEDIPSPTFTLVQIYEAAVGEIWHADLYRLTSPDEAIELGLDQAFEGAICFVEWPDRMGSMTPENALTLTLKTADQTDERVALFEWSDSKWTARIANLTHTTA